MFISDFQFLMGTSCIGISFSTSLTCRLQSECNVGLFCWIYVLVDCSLIVLVFIARKVCKNLHSNWVILCVCVRDAKMAREKYAIKKPAFLKEFY
jgi:hypothetical protein